MTPSTEIALREAVDGTVAQLRDPAFEQQVALALPEGVTPQRLLRVTQTAVLQEPKLAAPELRGELLKAVLKAAADGLMPDGREAVLIPRGGRNPSISYQRMVGGIIKIAAEYGWAMGAEVVYENDEFDNRGPLADPPIVHHPVRPGADMGDPIAAYAYAKHRRDGTLLTITMTRAQIEYVRDKAGKADGELWTTWWDRAWKKTVAHALFRKLPLDPNDKRIESLLAEGNGTSAKDLIFGRGTGPAAPAEPDPVPPQADQESPPAGGPDSPLDAGATGSIADEPVLEGEIIDEPDLDDDPGSAVVPDGLQAAGKTIADLAQDDKGIAWLVWAAGNTELPDDFRVNVAAFLDARGIAA